MKTAFSRLQNQMHKRKMICKTFLGDHKGICLYCFRLCRKRRKKLLRKKPPHCMIIMVFVTSDYLLPYYE